jgi:hypothetical protein
MRGAASADLEPCTLVNPRGSVTTPLERAMEKPVKKTAPKKPRATSSTAAPRAAAKPRAAASKPAKANPLRFEVEHGVIAEQAYSLFERSGHPHGRDVEFWLEAERQLKNPRKV